MSKEVGKILVVDDNADVLLTVEIVLRKQFHTVVTETAPERLQELLTRTSFDVILLDMNYSSGMTTGQEGLHWLQTIRQLAPDAKVILMTAYGGVELAVKAIKEGATDFLIKPWDNSRLLATVTAALRYSRSEKEVRELKIRQRSLQQFIGRESGPIIGESTAIQAVLANIDKVARTDANVLILGENGTGKELIAREIHRRSLRSDQVFINVDLGAITESLFESELFGHRKGAFTDAREDRAGRFEIAAGGTLFLDEIGNLSIHTQAKLLGALQDQRITRVGSNNPIQVDIRLICATNRLLNEMINQQQFRQDLLYRINTVEIHVPPLRERRTDIAVLADHFARQFARKYSKPEIRLHPDTLRKLEEYHWPGNIREFQHAMERAVIMGSRDMLYPDDFLLTKMEPQPEALHELNLDALEKQAILKAVAMHQGNLSQAARELGLGRTTLYRKLRQHGI